MWGCVLTLSAGQLSAFSSYAGALGAALGADLAALNAAVNTGFVGHLLLGCVSGFYADRLGAVAALAHGLGTGTAGALGVWALAAWPPRALRPAATAAATTSTTAFFPSAISSLLEGGFILNRPVHFLKETITPFQSILTPSVTFILY